MAPPTLQKRNVLVIEDEPTQRQILQQQLQSLGYRVLTAATAKEGLEIWKDSKDLRIVITDLVMPDMDGFEVVKYIRANETAHTYLIILTKYADKKSLTRALTLGTDDFVSKPVIRQELELRLKSAYRILRLEDHDKLIATFAELAATRGGKQDYHLKRIREYCLLLAEDLRVHHPELGITEQNVEDIANISVLHDIGTMCVPDSLINKRGRYTDSEYKTMKEHTLTGAKILEDIYKQTSSPFLQAGLEIVFAHHEKWDGTGYPKGLKGDEIPLSARIVAFADAYDAMLTRKPYRDPLPPANAEKLLVAEKGKQFDPLLIDSFLRKKEGFAEIHRNLCDPGSGW